MGSMVSHIRSAFAATDSSELSATSQVATRAPLVGQDTCNSGTTGDPMKPPFVSATITSKPTAAKPVTCSANESRPGHCITWNPCDLPCKDSAYRSVGANVSGPPSSSSSSSSAQASKGFECGATTQPPARTTSFTMAARVKPSSFSGLWSAATPTRSSCRPTAFLLSFMPPLLKRSCFTFSLTFSMPPSSCIDAHPNISGSRPASVTRAWNQSLCVFSQPCSSNTA
mmetsp:Transcript_23027/g.52830  ORF Transcript_23027/g.52830 Transcript_23027/m.52830 type:complete len:227 (+) Transcript_23027:70-750(+)